MSSNDVHKANLHLEFSVLSEKKNLSSFLLNQCLFFLNIIASLSVFFLSFWHQLCLKCVIFHTFHRKIGIIFLICLCIISIILVHTENCMHMMQKVGIESWFLLTSMVFLVKTSTSHYLKVTCGPWTICCRPLL